MSTTYIGSCRLHLGSGRFTKATLAIRSREIAQSFHLVEGRFSDLPRRDAQAAAAAKESLTLELEDGRTAHVFVTDEKGSFILSGPLE
jgi:hypothetical protein